MTEDLVEVRLLQLPLDVWQRTQEHVDGLLREFALIVQDDEARAATPGRLLSLIQELNTGYGQFSAEQRLAMEHAVGRGELVIDLTYRVPPGAAGAARQLGGSPRRGRRVLPEGRSPADPGDAAGSAPVPKVVSQ